MRTVTLAVSRADLLRDLSCSGALQQFQVSWSSARIVFFLQFVAGTTIAGSYARGNRGHQIPPPLRCCPWWVTLSRRPIAFASPLPGRLCANMTSSTKPEVHNVTQRHQRTTEPRSRATWKIGEVCTSLFWNLLANKRIYRDRERQKYSSQYSVFLLGWSND